MSPHGAAAPDPWWLTPQGHSLLSAISRLERSVPGAVPLGSAPLGRGEAVRLQAHLGLGFPAAEVLAVGDLARHRAETAVPPALEAAQPGRTAALAERLARQHDAQRDGPRWVMLTPLLALGGPHGPLPLADTERLAGRRPGRGALAALPQGPGQALLDLFHHRWLSLFYRGRQLHAPGLQWGPPSASPLARLLDALSGLGLPGPEDGSVRTAVDGRGPQGELPWLRHAGLLGFAPRSLDGLTTLMADRLGLPVRGRPFAGGWLPVATTDQARLGHTRLAPRQPGAGGLGVLGRRAWDASAAVDLHVGPVPPTRWDALLPGGADHARL
ncbi:type VI secretion system baseplate subunit TssG, partial [Ideonella livida]